MNRLELNNPKTGINLSNGNLQLIEAVRTEKAERMAADENLQNQIDEIKDSGGSGVVIDDTLTISGAAADSMTVGSRLNEKADLININLGFQAGINSKATTGAATGKSAETASGFSGGSQAESTTGAAVGENTIAGRGFSGGYGARAYKNMLGDKTVIDTIQLGEGTNKKEKTLQVYSYTLMNADGSIPTERIPNLGEKEDKSNKVIELSNTSTDTQYPSAKVVYDELKLKADKQTVSGGFIAGENAIATSGGAIGKDAVTQIGGAIGEESSTQSGGAVGYKTNSLSGGAIGYSAKTQQGGAVGEYSSSSIGFSGGLNAKSDVDSIQLGTGTNTKSKTLQVYNHIVMEADGSLPYVHIARPHIKTKNAETLDLNTVYDLGLQTNLTLTLPSANYGNFIQVDFLSGDTAPTLTISASSSALISDYDFVPENNKIYSLFFDYGRLDSTNYGWRFSYAEYSYTPESEG